MNDKIKGLTIRVDCLKKILESARTDVRQAKSAYEAKKNAYYSALDDFDNACWVLQSVKDIDI